MSAETTKRIEQQLGQEKERSAEARSAIMENARLISSAARQMVVGLTAVRDTKSVTYRAFQNTLLPQLRFVAESALPVASGKLAQLEADIREKTGMRI